MRNVAYDLVFWGTILIFVLIPVSYLLFNLFSGTPIAAAALLFGLAIFLKSGFGLLKTGGFMRATATSRTVRALAMGPVEISGTVELFDDSVTGPITRKECVYYFFTDSRAGSGSLNTAKFVEKSVPFFLNDGTGKVVVDPEGAMMDVKVSTEHFRKELNMMFREGNIAPGDKIYVLGTAVSNKYLPGRPPINNAEGMMIAKGSGPFVISDKPESAAFRGIRRYGISSLVVGAGFILTGLAMLLVSAGFF